VKGVFLDSFSGAAAELKGKNRTSKNVLSVLAKHPRVSTFDMSDLGWLRDIIESLLQRGLIVEVTEPYPWHRYKVTNDRAAAARVGIDEV